MTGAQLQAQARAWKRRHRLPDVRVGEIIAEVARLHDTTPVAIRGACRVAQVVEARRDAAVRLRNRGLSLRTIGLALGARHHTTVLHLLEAA